jgi:hypothetical protein
MGLCCRRVLRDGPTHGSLRSMKAMTIPLEATAPENPPGFVVRTEAQQAAWDNGYRLERGIAHGWLHYVSTTAPGSIWIAGCSGHGPWLLSIAHSGVAAEIGSASVSPLAGPGIATFVFPTVKELHAALDRVYKLAMSLPEAPLDRFKAKTASLPRNTEADRWPGRVPRRPDGLLG